MPMKNVTITIPTSTQTDPFELKMLVAGGLYEKGKLTAGQAAEIVGLSKRAFIEMLGKYGFSIFGYTADEVIDDFSDLVEWRKS